MRQHSKYLIKVYDEMDVYRQHMFDGKELTIQQSETFEKLEIIRGFLISGVSDVDVIKLAKNDNRLKIQDRRARELLSMAYEVFAELRQLKNREGVKYMYSEIMRKAAEKVIQDYQKLFNSGEDYRGAAALFREYKNILKEAAIIDGAYDNTKEGGEEKKKPTKIMIKRKTIINNGKVESDTLTENATYEIGNE